MEVTRIQNIVDSKIEINYLKPLDSILLLNTLLKTSISDSEATMKILENIREQFDLSNDDK